VKKTTFPILVALLLVACSSRDVGPFALTQEEKAVEANAVTKLMCRVENQARCGHVIDNRILFGRFFAPETLGGLDEGEKFRGRQVTTKFIAEAVAGINQCQKVTETSVSLVKNLIIAGGTYEFRGTSPLDQDNSACFLTQFTES